MSIKPIALIDEDEMQHLIAKSSALVIPVGAGMTEEGCTMLYAIPDTHRVVPVKPTREMINAALPSAIRESDEDKYRAIGMIICIWDEMLAAHTATASQGGE